MVLSLIYSSLSTVTGTAMSADKKRWDDDVNTLTLWESITFTDWKRIAVLLLIMFAGSVYHIHSLMQLRRVFGKSEIEIIRMKLEQAYEELHSLKEEHEYLVERNQQMRRSVGPFIDYETTRRRIQSGTKELWLYINYHLNKSRNESLAKADRLAILNEVANRKRSLLSDIEKLPTVDGYQKWRHNEAGSVSDLVQRRLRFLQNPEDCPKAKKLLCEVSTCGLGCQQHHLAYCLLHAYASERVLILRSYNWKNLAENRMQAKIFHLFSKTCNDIFNDTVRSWSAASFNSKVLALPTLHDLQEAVLPRFLPSFIPKDLSGRIARFNSDPAAWWIGQMLKYILNPRKEAQKIIHNKLLAIDFKSPTVGLHIRRTDKIEMEANRYELKEYMAHVEDYYKQLEQYSHVSVRRVYLATDEPEVLEEAIRDYPRYKFYSNNTVAQWAGLDSRMYPEAIMGTLLDIHMLAICDYVVCTFSSNIGRIVYELVQTYRLDAYTGFTSLDRYYYFTHGEPHMHEVVQYHKRNGSLDLEIGDTLKLRNQEIYCSALNLRTKIRGPFPWYKTVPLIPIYPYPEYKKVAVYADKRITLNF